MGHLRLRKQVGWKNYLFYSVFEDMKTHTYMVKEIRFNSFKLANLTGKNILYPVLLVQNLHSQFTFTFVQHHPIICQNYFFGNWSLGHHTACHQEDSTPWALCFSFREIRGRTGRFQRLLRTRDALQWVSCGPERGQQAGPLRNSRPP